MGWLISHLSKIFFSSFDSFGTDRQTQICSNEHILGTDEEKAFIKAIKKILFQIQKQLFHLDGISKGMSKQN